VRRQHVDTSDLDLLDDERRPPPLEQLPRDAVGTRAAIEAVMAARADSLRTADERDA
jgi:hypothetical protein